MKHIKRIAAAVLALCSLLALTACGGLQEKVESKLWETAAPILVQGNMDLLYKGVCDENYLKLVNSTQEDCLPYYEENMALQAQAIMAAFEINDVNNNQADRFIDNGVLSGLGTLYLIHGKGTGALRSAIHAHLRGHKNVRTFRLGAYGEGEAGVTVVELK